MTSMRRHYVASTSLRRHVPAGNLPPLAPQYSKPWPPNILNLPTPMNSFLVPYGPIYIRLLWSNFCIYIFMLSFSPSVFSYRRSLKIENEKKNTITVTAKTSYIGVQFINVETYPGLWLVACLLALGLTAL